jgi:hypothetical protein
MRLLLIPVADAPPAVQARLDGTPDRAPLSAEELRELVEVTRRYLRVTEALLRYATTLGVRRDRALYPDS